MGSFGPRKVCDSEEVFEERVEELRCYLVKKGFRNKDVDNQLQRVK